MLTMDRKVDSSRIPKDEVEDCLRAYLTYINEERALRCKPSVGKHYMTNIFPYFGKLLKDDKPYMEHIQGYIAGKQKTSIVTYVVAMKAFFKWLVATERLPDNPIDRMRCPTVEKRPRRTLTDEDMMKIFSVRMTQQQRIILQVLAETGCRRNEISCITLDDLPQDGAPRVIIIHGKGGKTRVCTISMETVDLIKQSFVSNPRKYLIQCQNGSPMIGPNVYSLFIDVMKSAGVDSPGDAMHMFRRTFITNLHRRGVPLATIQTLAGHSNMNTTFGYIHVNLSDIEKVYELEIFQMLTNIYDGKAKMPR